MKQVQGMQKKGILQRALPGLMNRMTGGGFPR
jgi:hypothetical protein